MIESQKCAGGKGFTVKAEEGAKRLCFMRQRTKKAHPHTHTHSPKSFSDSFPWSFMLVSSSTFKLDYLHAMTELPSQDAYCAIPLAVTTRSLVRSCDPWTPRTSQDTLVYDSDVRPNKCSSVRGQMPVADTGYPHQVSCHRNSISSHILSPFMK